jgi:hypothetical protein
VRPRVRTLPSCPDPVGFVLSLNLHRRHLDESQRGIVAAKARALFAEQAKARMLAGTKASDPTPNLGEGSVKGESADQAAVAVNVSRGTVEAASKVLKHGVPELVEAVERGQVAVSAAAVVASLPAEEQREAVAGGAAAVREKAVSAAPLTSPSTGTSPARLTPLPDGRRCWDEAPGTYPRHRHEPTRDLGIANRVPPVRGNPGPPYRACP